MLKIAICDDNNTEILKLISFIEEYVPIISEYKFQIYSFSNPYEFLRSIDENDYYDISFLDVYMPEMLGTEVARKLRENGDKCEIIFVTYSTDHAIEAFKVDALQYIVKPYERNEIFTVLDKAISKIDKLMEKYVIFQTRNMATKLSVSDIVYSESYKHNQNIKTIDGKTITVRMTVIELFNILGKYGEFVKNGSSYIINLKYVREIKAKEVLTDTGDIIPVPRGYYSTLKDEYMAYMFSGGGI